MWNPSSVMFEVAWCVTLYSTVLALEVSGMVFEKLRWRRAVKVQHALVVPLVVAGVILSTLHQSSLGTLYLIVPTKLHPLWYSPMLPVLFWISAIAAAFAMVIVESRLSARAFRRHLEMPLLADVGRILLAVLCVYGAVRVFDLLHRGVLDRAVALDYEGSLFLVEAVLGLVLPIGLLASPRLRHNSRTLYAAALLAVLGFVVNRLNVSITGFDGASGGHYVPSWAEAALSLMMVALGFAAFGLAVRYLDVFPAEGGAHPRAPGAEPPGHADPEAPMGAVAAPGRAPPAGRTAPNGTVAPHPPVRPVRHPTPPPHPPPGPPPPPPPPP
jgi:Ni/Fe-hydrogenase subunit HybB-like protein